MGFQKFGSGQVTGTEGALSKTAAQTEWTDEDEKELAEENTEADGER